LIGPSLKKNWNHGGSPKIEGSTLKYRVPSLWPSYLSMNKGSLFCFVVMRSTNPGLFQICVLGVFGTLSTRMGAWAWFHDIWTCGAKILEY